ncbi:MAG: hypothetical protein FWD26_04590 [Treponema sp.]|nr:hypothetical protein [Treponema sp.]
MKNKNHLYIFFLLVIFTLSFSCKKTGNGETELAREIFNSLKGQKVTTYGWADLANDGEGMTYANPDNFILINDEKYPTAEKKYFAFIDANYTTRPDIAANGVISHNATHVNNNPKFIIISGDIDLSNGRITDDDNSHFDQFGPAPDYRKVNGDIALNIGSNTTIIGINNARIMFGGLVISDGRNNIIIRNVTFWDTHGSTAQDTDFFPNSKANATGLQIEDDPGGHSIWINHCKFTDGTCSDLVRNYNHDGAFDIKFGRFITVSWNEFTNHDKVMLVGSNDNTPASHPELLNYINPTERQITLHHNYFHGVTQRMPRTRGTQMHVYNNYYNNIGNMDNGGSYMGLGANAQFIVENNYFEPKVKPESKTIEYFNSAADQAYPPRLYYNGNNVPNSNSSWWGRTSTPMASLWTPGYDYPLDDNADLPVLIPGKAGPTLEF